ncbi:hypothetical protein AAVH_42202, partial [Aphelenchoides avenae]
MCQYRPEFIRELIERRAEKHNNRFWCKQLDGGRECRFVRVDEFTEKALVT